MILLVVVSLFFWFIFFVINKSPWFNSLNKTTTEDIDKTFTLLSPDITKINFENHVIEDPNRSIYFFDYFYNGSGVAIGDINNDDLPDIFFTGNDVSNRLYVNKGNLVFEDITEKSGIESNRWSTGVTLVDINNDGWLDIYVCNSGPYLESNATTNELYINNQDNTFSEKAKEYGIADNSRSIQASFFDMDGDGDLDLWVMNHSLRLLGNSYEQWFQAIGKLSSNEYSRECNTLYRNEGNGTFTDVSRVAGIEKIGFGLGLAIRDFDEDGYLDIYIANDYLIPDFMFINNGDGTFTDKIHEKVKHISYYAMGCDASDFNNDGLSDLVVVDMTPADHIRNKTLMNSMDVESFRYLTEYRKFIPQYMFNSLLINNGYGIMSDIALFSGVSQTDWSWAPLLVDIDNDGLKDLVVTNGYRKDTKDNDWRNALTQIKEEKGEAFTAGDFFEHLKKAKINPVPNQVFKNIDGLNFENVTSQWNFDTPSFSNGAAYGDLDNDGDLDFVMNNFDSPAFIYRNNTQENEKQHFIRFKLKEGLSSNSVLHSQIYIYYGDKMQRTDFVCTRGYQSHIESFVHFGLGNREKIDSVVIQWSNGDRSFIINPKIDQVHTIDKIQSTFVKDIKEQVSYSFINNTTLIQPPFMHKENVFDDFQKEVLLPHRQSMLGPALAVGDVNNDGFEDFYIGGAKDQVGSLYLQTQDGRFNSITYPVFEIDKVYEDVGAIFVDVDGDFDLDLYVASGGGGDFKDNLNLLQDRLYINDGKGNYSSSSGRLPEIESSTKTIASTDVDVDGDMDLFIGGRTKPGEYPLAPNSYLLINEEGIFKDQTQELAPQLSQLGMITDAEWSDIDSDGRIDLMVVGEWMPITVLRNTETGFINITEGIGLENTSAWWASLCKTDIDHDGDDDFVIGNVGLNNKYHPTFEKPLYLYANDFDKNGSLDIVLSKIYNDKKVPVRGKECSSAQMPFISEKFPTYIEFASANLEDIYQKSDLDEASQYVAYNFASVYIENNGEGKFKIRELPVESQLSPINGIIPNDFDNDGILDLILAGNMIQTEVETPAYDAGKGLFLQGLGKGNFKTSLQLRYSGLFLHRDVKDIQLIHLGIEKRPAILVANNNDILELFVYNK